MAAESGAGAPAQGGHNVPVVKSPLAGAKPVEDVVNYSKRSIDDSEFFKDIPPDELLEAMGDDGEPEERPRRARPKPDREPAKPTKRKPEPEPEPEEDDDDESAAAAAEDDEPEETSDAEPEESSETKAWAPPEGKGTKDAPLTLKDLPAELFVELTVNGEKVTVDLKEAGKGYMRRQAFDQQVSKVKQGLTEAHDIAEKAVSAQERYKQQIENTRAGFEVFIKEPKRVLAALFDNVPDKRRIVEALIEDHEDAYEELSFAYAEFRQREDALQKDGYATSRARRAQARDQGRRQREQAKLDEERRQIAVERQRWEQEQAEKTRASQDSEKKQAAQRAAFALLKPGLDAGLLALGMKDLTPELNEELQVRLGVTKRVNGGRPLTADDVKKAVIRAGESLGIKPGAQPRPAPAPTGGAPRRQEAPRKPANGSNGSKFDGVPQARLVRDINWYLNE
jgi:hypothetical protein